MSLTMSLAEQLTRSSFLEKAVTQCGIALWATDLDGEILLSEGGLRDPESLVGQHISQFSNFSHWQEATRRFAEGLKKVSFISKGSSGNRMWKSGGTSLHEVWLETYSPLLSPSGRPAGVLAISLPVSGAISTEAVGFCPLGECVIGSR